MKDVIPTLEDRFELAISFPTHVATEAKVYPAEVQAAIPVLRWLLRGIVPDDLLNAPRPPIRPMGALPPIEPASNTASRNMFIFSHVLNAGVIQGGCSSDRKRLIDRLIYDMCRADVYAEWLGLRRSCGPKIPISMALMTGFSHWNEEAEPIEPLTWEPEAESWRWEVNKFIAELEEAMISPDDEDAALSITAHEHVIALFRRSRSAADSGALSV